MPEGLIFARCWCASADYKITPEVPDCAKNSFDGLRRQAAAGLRIRCAALAAMAISSATSTF
jgi:hypothetical protein